MRSVGVYYKHRFAYTVSPLNVINVINIIKALNMPKVFKLQADV